MKKAGQNKVNIKNRVIIVSALLLALNLSAMDAELQLLVEQPGALSAPACAAGAQSDAGAQDASPAKLQTKPEDAELYNLIGERNKHYFEGHEQESVWRAYDRLKLEQHVSFMVLKQFDFEQQPHLVLRRKHPAMHSMHTQTHKPSTHLQGDDLSGHAKQQRHGKHMAGRQQQPQHSAQELDDQVSNQLADDGQEGEDRGRRSEQDEKEQDQDRTVLEKGRELAQAEFIAALLSVLSQQHKERADKLAQEKEKSDSELRQHQEEAVKKDKCATCLKRTTALVGILGVLATAWGTVMTSLCSQQGNGK